MVRTRVGYAGGSAPKPTYRNLGDHAETIQIDYDPTQISYEELLEIFWQSHSPTSAPWSRQYMSMILYHNEQQRRLALASRDSEAVRRGGRIFTEILPAGRFYRAEGYHQKYGLRGMSELMEEFRAMYPDGDDFVNSTAAARVNGYLGGHGTLEALEAEIDSLGLSPAGQQRLLAIVAPRQQQGCAES